MTALPAPWHVSGSYFESCNCDAICPCRSVRGRPGGPSTHGICFGVLSWLIDEGRAGAVDLGGLGAVLSVRYRDDVQPATPWEVVLYVDERADAAQREALADIFLGRAGGTPFTNYAHMIGTVHAVRAAGIGLDHAAERRRIGVRGYVTVEAHDPASGPGDVQCGIPGFDHPGQELRTELNRSEDPVLSWKVRGTAAFAGEFAYTSEG